MNFLIILLKRESPGGTTPGDFLLSDERMDILISFSCQYIYHAEYGFSRLLRNFFVSLSVDLCYNGHAVDSLQQEGGAQMDYLISFLISIVASIVAYYICKWLDRDE
jgi:hypothetical protein